VYENLILSLSLVCALAGLFLARSLRCIVLAGCLAPLAALRASVAIGERRQGDCGAVPLETYARESVAGHFTAATTIDDSG
jgi:hypothetical protein